MNKHWHKVTKWAHDVALCVLIRYTDISVCMLCLSVQTPLDSSPVSLKMIHGTVNKWWDLEVDFFFTASNKQKFVLISSCHTNCK